MKRMHKKFQKKIIGCVGIALQGQSTLLYGKNAYEIFYETV